MDLRFTGERYGDSRVCLVEIIFELP